MSEGSLEVLHRLPHGVVEKDTASAYTSMKLCRDVTWLVPHPISISRPRRQQLLNILGGDRERVDKDHGSGVHLQLRKNRDVLIHLFKCYHWSSCSFLPCKSLQQSNQPGFTADHYRSRRCHE